MVHGTFSPAGRWRPTVVARLAQTLGVIITVSSFHTIESNMRPVLLCLFLSLPASSTIASDMTPVGASLERICQQVNPIDLSFCNGYIAGVLGGRLAYVSERVKATGVTQFMGNCLNGKVVSQPELRSVVLSYIARNRSKVAEIDAAYAVSQAVAEAYPCQ